MMLDDKVIIVTGAAQGIGRGIVEVCLREGATCVVADKDVEPAQDLVSNYRGRFSVVQCDVGNTTELDAVLKHCLEHHGQVDGLVNNAGITFSKPLLETTADDWERVLRANLGATFHLSREVCRQMLTQRPTSGSIIAISSVHARATAPGHGPYAATKSGQISLMQAIALEFAQRGIRANTISPGLCQTATWESTLAKATDRQACARHWLSNIPLNRTIEPREIGELAAFLLSDHGSAITGADLVIDGGIAANLLSRKT